MWGRWRAAISGEGREPKKRRRPFGQRLLSALPVIAGSILLALLYGNSALFRSLEAAALDFMMRAREQTGNSDIVIVRITDEDYRKYFGGKSPLDPAEVGRVIAAISAARPKVIGVDLDTSPESFQSLEPSPDWPPVVWARGASYSHTRRKFLLSGVLGRNPPLAPYGLVTLKLDSDGAVRRYARWYDTDAGPAPSLPWAMLKKFRNDESPTPAAPDFEEEFLVDYVGPSGSEYFFRIPVSTLYSMAEQGGLGGGNLLENKMVILGGDYAVQNEHDTPVGWMIGAQVLAAITETEQRGGGRKPIGVVAVVLLGIFDSIVLLSLIHVFGLWKTLLISIVVVPLMAVLLSLLLFGSVSHAGGFFLILLAVLTHQVYENGKNHLKKWRERAAEEIK